MNADTGQIIYGKNENVAHANASTTKIMTCILALENCKLNEKVKFSPYAASIEPSKLYANAGEIFYLKDLLYSLMLPSHNDTAVAIAEHVSGSTAKFVKLMNKKAAEIGCTNTHFATPNGLDAGYNHYTTASDLAKIAQYAIKKPMFRKLVSTGYYSFSNLNTGRSYSIGTTNALLGNVPGVQGMKTGYTNKAGYCFVGLSWIFTHNILDYLAYRNISTNINNFFDIACGGYVFSFLVFLRIFLYLVIKRPSKLIDFMFGFIQTALLLFPLIELIYFSYYYTTISTAASIAFLQSNPNEVKEYLLQNIGVLGIFCFILGILSKNSKASSTVISNTSAISSMDIL